MLRSIRLSNCRAPGASGFAQARILTSDVDYIHETEDLGDSMMLASLNNSLPIVNGCTDSLCEMSKLTTKRMSGWLNSEEIVIIG